MDDIHYITGDLIIRRGASPDNKNEWATLCGTWADYQHTVYLSPGSSAYRTLVTCDGCILINFTNKANNE